MLETALQILNQKYPSTSAEAHCDGPCGVYDPASARIAAEAAVSDAGEGDICSIPSLHFEIPLRTHEVLQAGHFPKEFQWTPNPYSILCKCFWLLTNPLYRQHELQRRLNKSNHDHRM